jgi:hypothetical protein
MSVSRIRSFVVLCTTASLCLVALGALQAASAAATSPPAGNGYSSTPGSGVSAQAVSPSGCVQFADRPHSSTTSTGRVNGKVRAVCNVTVPKMSFSAQLWETRWWGWDRIGVNQPYSRAWSKFGRAMANDWCKNNTVRVTGNGYVIDRDGRSYYASTVSNSVTNPCSK